MTFHKETEFQDTPIGKIPKKWRFGKLVEFSKTGGDPVQTGPFGAQLHASDYAEDGVPLILIKNVSNGKIVDEDMPRVAKNKASELTRYRLRMGDIVFSRVGSVGRAAVIRKHQEGWLVSGQMLRVRLENPEIDNDFLSYVIDTNWFQKALASRTVGATRKSINTEILSNLPMVVPDISEQKGIVGVLGVVDSAIGLVDEVIWKTERLKKGLMQQLLTRGIGHKEYKDTKLGRIPKNWKIENIGGVCKVVTGGTPSTSHPEYFGGNIRWLKSGDIKRLYIYDSEEKITQLGIDNSNAKIHPANTVAIALSGRGQTRGRTTIIKEPMACSQSVAIMIPNSELIPEYLHYNLSNRYLEIRNLTGHLDRSGLNLTIVSDIEIPIPPLTEQEKITRILVTVDRKLELEIDEKTKLERVKSGLMDLLLTGKIRVKVD